MNHDYFVFNRLEDGRHENIIHYFRYHVPSRDDNRGRCKSWRYQLATTTSLIKFNCAAQRIVAILFQHPVSALCTESRLKFSVLHFP